MTQMLIMQVSTFFLKGSDGKIFQALWNIQSLSQLLNSAAVAQRAAINNT